MFVIIASPCFARGENYEHTSVTPKLNPDITENTAFQSTDEALVSTKCYITKIPLILSNSTTASYRFILP